MNKTLLLIVFFLSLPLSWADGFFTDVSDEWFFYQTSDAKLNFKEISSDHWVKVKPLSLLNINPNNGIYGWYKISFDWDQKFPKNDLQLYIQNIRYADETWLNTVKIGELGTLVNRWDIHLSNPQNLPRKYAIPNDVLKDQNTLFIKVNLGFSDAWGAMYPGGVGIGGDVFGIGSKTIVSKKYNQHILMNTIVDTIIITLGVVDILVILFLFRRSIHHFNEFWWLLIGSMLMITGSLFLDYLYVLDIYPKGYNLLLFFSILFSPFATIMFFWSIYKNINFSLVCFIAILWLCIATIFFIPEISPSVKNVYWFIWNILVFLGFFYCLYCALYGVKFKYVGAKAQLFGLVVYLLSIRTQWLPYDFFEHRNILIGSLVLRYFFLFSYFQRISQMSKDYKQLSHRMLETIENHKQDIARDLHDNLGQYLSAAKIKLLYLDKKDVKKNIANLKEDISYSIQSVRELMQGLHPIILEKYGLIEAIQKEISKLSLLYGIKINFSHDVILVNKIIEKHLFRIFQETLNNSIKHGKSSQVNVAITLLRNQIIYRISDNGIGFHVNKALHTLDGLGLISLKERVNLLNGRVDIHSEIAKGTTIQVTLPKK